MSNHPSIDKDQHGRIMISNLEKIIRSLVKRGTIEKMKSIELHGYKITITKIK